MADRYVLDAHALVWFLVGSPKTVLHLASSGAAVALLTRDVDITASRAVPIVW
jgi:hypothetical protein